MNLKAQRAAALKAAQDIIKRAQTEGRELTEAEQGEVSDLTTQIADLDAKIQAAEESDRLIKQVGNLVGGGEDDGGAHFFEAAKTLGDHFVEHVGLEGLARVKATTGASVSAPEFKEAEDTHLTPATFGTLLTDQDRTMVRSYRRPVISDLLGSGNISGNAVTYFVEGGVEGDFGMVAPGGQKPQIHFLDPTTRTDSLKKIAGFMKFTDEMIEDAAFWISEINNRGLYMLALAEENQLINGAGTGNTVLGLLNRSGIQTETAATAADNPDALFRAMTKVQTATGLTTDGLIINPLDYQKLRLSKDENGQYFGGGFFQGQYGNGGMAEQPPVWGLRTVVSTAVAAGTAIVSAFKASTTVYRKGGIRVESTNSHDVDFTSNLITTRIEERVALAVRVPAATVEVTLL